MKAVFAVAGCALIMQACKTGGKMDSSFADTNAKQVKPFIAPPIQGVDIPIEKIAFNAGKSQVLRPANGKGTTISIPAGALTDAQGKPFNGEAVLSYREFHTAADIFVSGIPMTMKVEGKDETFETAGMFEIRAHDTKGNTLNVKPGMNVTVRMGSMQSDSTYRFFYLNEEDKNWAYQGEGDPEINTERVEMVRKMNEKIPAHAIPFTDGYAVLNYHSLLDMLANNNYHAIAIMEKSPKIKDKLRDYNVTPLSVSIYAEIAFKGRKYPADAIVWKMDNPSKMPPSGDTRSAQVYALGKNKYRFVLEYYDGRKFKGNMEAVMTVQQLFAKDAAYWQNEYETVMAEVKELERMIAEKEVVYRTFELGGFGIFNWDKFIKQDQMQPVMVHTQLQFSTPLHKTEDLRTNVFYMIMPGNNSLVRLNPDVFFSDSLLLRNMPGSMIITTLYGGKLARISAEEYNKIPFESLKRGSTVDLFFTVSDDKIESLEDVKRFLKT